MKIRILSDDMGQIYTYIRIFTLLTFRPLIKLQTSLDDLKEAFLWDTESASLSAANF